MAEGPKKKPSQTKPREKRAKPTYANTVWIVPGISDLTVIGGLQRYIEDRNAMITDEQTATVLPWPAVKRLAFMLMMCVFAYEKKNGPVRVLEHQIPAMPPVDAVGPYGHGSLQVMHRELFAPDQARADFDAAMARALVRLDLKPH